MITSWSSKPSEEIKNQVEEIINDKLTNFIIGVGVILIIALMIWGSYHIGYNNGLLFNGG